MRVTKWIMCMVFISMSLFGKDIFRNDISLGLGFNVGHGTIDRYDIEFLPTLNYRFYLLRDYEERQGAKMSEIDKMFEQPDFHEEESGDMVTLYGALYLDFMFRLRFTSEHVYEDFLAEDKSFYELFLGMGYMFNIKNNYYFSVFGGGNFYYESNKKYFITKNASEDIDMEHIPKEDSFIDYGFYLGLDTTFLLPKNRLDNLFSISVAMIYNYKIRLKEHNFMMLLNTGFKF